jgi:hypothetical protein
VPTYCSTISLSTRTLTHLAELLRAHRRGIGSRSRRLEGSQKVDIEFCGSRMAILSQPSWPLGSHELELLGRIDRISVV